MLCVLDLFSGIGGFALGLERTGGFQTNGFCEIEPFCKAVLKKHWPNVWLHDDITTLTGELVRERCGVVDLICGGFPCTDISVAGRGAGIHAARSGLWWQMRRVIEEVEPSWLLIENVGALRTRGADDVLASLEALGYECWPLVVGAWAVGAPHRRERVWIVAHAAREFPYRSGSTRRGRTEFANSCSGVGLADSFIPRLEGQRNGSGGTGSPFALPAGVGGYRWPARPGEQQYEWEEPRVAYSESNGLQGRQTRQRSASRATTIGGSGQGQLESAVGLPTPGLPSRLAGWNTSRWRREALKALGNAVVPQVVEQLGYAILSIE